MDDFDIYGDLQLLQEQGKQKAEEDSQWKEKYLFALGTIEKLQAEKKQLGKKVKQLETNFASLFDTARAEIKRKDNQIAELRREKDDLCFRRVVRPGGKYSSQEGSRNENVNRLPRDLINTRGIEIFPPAKSAGYTKLDLKNVEESKGPEHIGQSRNPFQGESYRRLHTSEDNDKGSKENLASLRSQRQNDVISESKKHAKRENIMKEDILNDLKELKKRKQYDAKESESKKLAQIAANEKTNILFDALFEDLAIRKENSEANETEMISETVLNERKIVDDENNIVVTNLLTPKKSVTRKHLDDPFNATLEDHVEFSTEQRNSNQMEKTEVARYEKILKLSPKTFSIKAFNMVDDPIGERNNDIKAKISELGPGKHPANFIFAELDSSFYSNKKQGSGKGNEKLPTSENYPMPSNLNRNCEDLNEITVAEECIEDTSGKKSKLESPLAKCFNSNETLPKKNHANEESKSKNVQIDRKEKISSQRHTSEQKEVKSYEIMTDFFKHSNRSKHYKSPLYAQPHRQEKESGEEVLSGFTSKASLGSSSKNTESKCERKYERDFQLKDKENDLNEYVSIEKKQDVSLEKIKSPSFDDVTLQSAYVKDNTRSDNKKQQILNKISTLDFKKISDADGEDISKKVAKDDLRGINFEKENLIENITDNLTKKEIKDDFVTELNKQLHSVHRKTDDLENKLYSKIDTLDPSAKKNDEEHKSDAPYSESVLRYKFSIDSKADMLSKDECKIVIKQNHHTRKEHFLKNTDFNVSECDKSKKEGHNCDVLLGRDENSDKVEKINHSEINISKHSVKSKQNSIDISKDMRKSNNLSNMNLELSIQPLEQAIDDCGINSFDEKTLKLTAEKKQSDENPKQSGMNSNQISEKCADSNAEKSNVLSEANNLSALNLELSIRPLEKAIDGCGINSLNEKILKLTPQKEQSDENPKQGDMKSNQISEKSADSIVEKSNVLSEANISNKYNVSPKQELEAYNKEKNECDTKEAIGEINLYENEHLEMPPLLVEEESEDVTPEEKFTEIKLNSKKKGVSKNIVSTEKRIHHKKRMLQNSRTAEHVKNISSIQCDVNKASILSSNKEQTSKQSIPSNGAEGDTNEINNKISSDSSISNEKQNDPFKPLFSILRDCWGQNLIESVDKYDSNEMYKKKILQKYENSNETRQCDSSITVSYEANASSLTQCNNNNYDTNDLEKLMDVSDIAMYKDDGPTLNNSNLRANKEPNEETDSNVLCKSNILQKCDKYKELENNSLSAQCEKRKLPLTLEPETVNQTKVLKCTKELICKNPKTNILKDSIVCLVSNMVTSDMIPLETGKVSNHLNYSPQPGSIVLSENIDKEQSNEVSSQSLVRNGETLSNVDCTRKLTKSRNTDDISLNGCHLKKEDRTVIKLSRKTKLINIPKEKNIKRKLSSDMSDTTGEEKFSKKTKKRESKSPNKLKSIPLNSKKQINQTDKKYKKPSSSSPENSLICEINTNPIHHNIFSNDGCPGDRSLPAICNDDDVQYQEIDNRLRSMFQSPTYKPPAMENMIDPKCDTSPQENNDLRHTANETLNKSEKSQCDTSISSRKISVGSNDYVIETVGAHVANVFVTRKKCKKRTKTAVATV